MFCFFNIFKNFNNIEYNYKLFNDNFNLTNDSDIFLRYIYNNTLCDV